MSPASALQLLDSHLNVFPHARSGESLEDALKPRHLLNAADNHRCHYDSIKEAETVHLEGYCQI